MGRPKGGRGASGGRPVWPVGGRAWCGSLRPGRGRGRLPFGQVAAPSLRVWPKGGQWAKAHLPFWPEWYPVVCGQWAKVRLPSGEPIGR